MPVQAKQLVVVSAGPGEIAGEHRRAHLLHQPRRCIRGHRDDAMCSQHHQRQRCAVIAAVNRKAFRRAPQHLCAALHVAGRILEADNIRNLRQAQHRVVLQVRDRTAWNVVDNLRKIHRLRDGAEMPVQPFLGGLVVIGHNRQAQVGTGSLGIRSQLDSFARRIGAGTSDDRNTASRVLDGRADQKTVFFEIHRRRFAGGPDHDDAVAAFANVEIDQPAQPFEVKAAVLEHRRDNGNEASL